MVAQGAHKRHVVLDHQQGDAALGQALEQTAQLFGLDVVQACGGFIQQQNLRLGHDGAHHLDALLDAVGQIGHHLARIGAQARVGQSSAGALTGTVATGQRPRRTQVVFAQHHVLDCGQMRHEPDVLKRARQAVRHPVRHRHVGDVLAQGADAPGVDRVHTRDQVEHRGLARPIGANQGGAAAFGHGKADVVNHLQPTKRFAHTRELQHRAHARPPADVSAGARRPPQLARRFSSMVRVTTPWGRHIMIKTTAKPNKM